MKYLCKKKSFFFNHVLFLLFWGRETLIIAEDTDDRAGPSNFAWAWYEDTGEMVPIVQSVDGAEISNGYVYSLGYWDYMVFAVNKFCVLFSYYFRFQLSKIKLSIKT